MLVNNAGITRDTLAMRMKDDDWDAVLDTNLKGVFRMSRAVMRTMMKQRYGRIVSITSVVGASGNPGQANYAAAKAGLIGLSQSLAAELGSRDIRVNVVLPGVLPTGVMALLWPSPRSGVAAGVYPAVLTAGAGLVARRGASAAAAFVALATLQISWSAGFWRGMLGGGPPHH